MTQIEVITTQALKLSDRERAVLASELLRSIPAPLYDDDAGIEEAERRDRELNNSANSAMTWSEIKRSLGR